MDDALRCFVALVPGPSSRALLAREGAGVFDEDPAVRPVAAPSLHWTLAFLGATPPDRVGAITSALAHVAAATPPFAVRLAGLSAFPSPARPRVVWAGLEPGPGADAMARLAGAVARALTATGASVDTRSAFHPHLTLARVEGGSAGPALRERLTGGALQSTYSPEVLSDLLLMVSEHGIPKRIPKNISKGISRSDASPEAASNDGGSNDGRQGTRYRVLATLPLGAGCEGRGGP